jgi:hypothetical protein
MRTLGTGAHERARLLALLEHDRRVRPARIEAFVHTRDPILHVE